MPDFRVADTAPEHPKLRLAGLAAAGLWSLAGAWSMRELTDGFVPKYWVATWPSGTRHAAKLVEVGLWYPAERSGQPGWRFHDWLDIQRSAASVHNERAEARERARKRREGAKKPGASDKSSAELPTKSHDSRALPGPFPGGGSVGGQVPEADARAATNGRPPRCPKHAPLPPDQQVPPCGACMQLRLAAEQAAADHAADQAQRAAEQAARRQALIDLCPDCDGDGERVVGDYGAVICVHPSLTEAAS